ncbi:zinc finger, CCHC-type containing LTR copia-type gag-polypeptide, partial [Tanacetum coccineum]
TSNNSHGRGGSFSSRGTSSRGRGRGQNRRPPHCQLCRTNGYYASACPSLATYATQASTTDESLAKAFHAQCHVTTNSPDWHVDSRATDHMTSSCDSLNYEAPYKGNAKVLYGNGKTLPITHKGSSIISNNIPLKNVLVIPSLTKKLLSVSKLTTDHPVDVLLSQPFFYIHDRITKKVLASGGNNSSETKKYKGSNSSDGGNTGDGVKIASGEIRSHGGIGGSLGASLYAYIYGSS